MQHGPRLRPTTAPEASGVVVTRGLQTPPGKEAVMRIKPQCSEMVTPRGQFYMPVPPARCERRGAALVEGKWYCRQHARAHGGQPAAAAPVVAPAPAGVPYEPADEAPPEITPWLRLWRCDTCKYEVTSRYAPAGRCIHCHGCAWTVVGSGPGYLWSPGDTGELHNRHVLDYFAIRNNAPAGAAHPDTVRAILAIEQRGAERAAARDNARDAASCAAEVATNLWRALETRDLAGAKQHAERLVMAAARVYSAVQETGK